MRYYTTKACKTCELKSQCIRSKGCRRIQRWEHEEVLEELAQRLQAKPEKVKQRKGLVEHPFGIIKWSMDQGYFLTRRLGKVRTEMSLTMLAYNMKRVMGLVSIEQLLAALPG